VVHLEKGQKFQTEYKYQYGLVKDEVADYRSNDDLDSYSFHYQYDGNGRLVRGQVEVAGKDAAALLVKYDPHTGLLDTYNGLKFEYRDRTNTHISDGGGARGFRATYSLSPYGDLKSVSYSINGKDVFEMGLNYDASNRVAESRIAVGRSARESKLAYDADGRLKSARGRRTYEYSYDDNGNCVRASEEGETWNLAYDAADRLITFAEHEWNK
jgi:hypothetical protein